MILDLRPEHRRDVDAKGGDLVMKLPQHEELRQEIRNAGGALRRTIEGIECLVWLSEAKD
jgi:hypothetical protein